MPPVPSSSDRPKSCGAENLARCPPNDSVTRGAFPNAPAEIYGTACPPNIDLSSLFNGLTRRHTRQRGACHGAGQSRVSPVLSNLSKTSRSHTACAGLDIGPPGTPPSGVYLWASPGS